MCRPAAPTCRIGSQFIGVAVLPPVSVESWTSENLGDRIAEVRQLFVDTLANWPEARPGV